MSIIRTLCTFGFVALFAAGSTGCKESKAGGNDDDKAEKSDKKSNKSEKSDDKSDDDEKPKAAKAPLAIGSIKPQLVDDFDGKGKYLKVAFEITPSAKIPSSKDLRVKMVCNVSGKKMTEKPTALLNMAEIGKGETKKHDVSAWVLDPLAKAPSQCTITFFYGDLISEGDDDVKVTEVCFKPPSKVTDGACAD